MLFPFFPLFYRKRQLIPPLASLLTMYLAEFSSFPSFSPFRDAKKQSLLDEIDLVSRCFDESIFLRLKTLKPASISLSWLALAVDFLSFTHKESEVLISNLRLSSLDESLAWYLDCSVKLLDLCNSVSSCIDTLRQRRLKVKFASHLLQGSDLAPEKLRRARDSLSDFRSCSPGLKGRSFQAEIEVFIRDLAAGLASTPRGKISTVGRLIRRTINAVVLVTVFVAESVVRSLYGSPKLVALRVPAEYSWAESFNDLETSISAELKQRFSGEKIQRGHIQEIDELESRMKEACKVIDEATVTGEVEKMRLNDAVKGLEKATETFSDGLERLGEGINGMFHTVLRTRNVMLENFRDGQKSTK